MINTKMVLEIIAQIINLEDGTNFIVRESEQVHMMDVDLGIIYSYPKEMVRLNDLHIYFANIISRCHYIKEMTEVIRYYFNTEAEILNIGTQVTGMIIRDTLSRVQKLDNASNLSY